MAVTVTTNDLSGAVSVVRGNKREFNGRITFDATYPAGGEVVTPSMLGLNFIESLVVTGSTTGQVAVPLRQADGTYKLQLREEVGGVEEATADQSAVIVTVQAIGI